MKKSLFIAFILLLTFKQAFSQSINYQYHVQNLGNIQSISYTFEHGRHNFNPGIGYYTKGQLRFDSQTDVSSVAPKNIVEKIVLNFDYQYQLKSKTESVIPFIGVAFQYSSVPYRYKTNSNNSETGIYEDFVQLSTKYKVMNTFALVGFNFPLSNKISYYQSFAFGRNVKTPNTNLAVPNKWDMLESDWTYALNIGLSYQFKK